ncbi:hypothetical protein PI125_g24634 [Phytophthora idaei]|nr:hypothetical protein PI125_g24634 [Phytophthora idaei]
MLEPPSEPGAQYAILDTVGDSERKHVPAESAQRLLTGLQKSIATKSLVTRIHPPNDGAARMHLAGAPALLARAYFRAQAAAASRARGIRDLLRRKITWEQDWPVMAQALDKLS